MIIPICWWHEEPSQVPWITPQFEVWTDLWIRKVHEDMQCLSGFKVLRCSEHPKWCIKKIGQIASFHPLQRIMLGTGHLLILLHWHEFMANERISVHQVGIQLDGTLEEFDGLFLNISAGIGTRYVKYTGTYLLYIIIISLYHIILYQIVWKYQGGFRGLWSAPVLS